LDVEAFRGTVPIWVNTRCEVVKNDEGRVIALRGTMQDITPIKTTEAELRSLTETLEVRVREEVDARETAQARLVHAQKMQVLGQLAGGIAHDFNNILQGVLGAATLLDRRAADAGRVRSLATMVEDACGRGVNITSRLLAFSRQSKLTAEPLNAADVLNSIREVLGLTLGSPIDVHAVLEPDLPLLLADKGQLETALVNLGTNARDAMPDGGRLTLSAAREQVGVDVRHPAGLAGGGYVRISVSDTGVGMDAATLAHASEPFFTTKPKSQGTGLGLAMVRGFVEQSHGGFFITSAPGQGTTVNIWLPETVASDAADQGCEPVAHSSGGVARRVLLVDDDKLVREIVVAQLEEAGHIVHAASSGLEALALLDDGTSVDVLVSDLSMPGMNGVATIREAQLRYPNLPAVLLTGYAGDLAGLVVQDCSFLLLRKPVHGATLANCIEDAIGGSKAA
jgi:signal transduction histidine kinase/CheY-like chemotaxis protein